MAMIPIQSGASPIGSLLSGFMQGFEGARKNAEAENEHDLKVQLLKLQQKKLDAEENIRKLREQVAGKLEAPQQVTETIGGEAPEQVAPGPMGFTGLSPELAAPTATTTTEKPAGIRNQLLAQAVREGKVSEALKPEPKTLAEQLIEIEQLRGGGGGSMPGNLPLQGFTLGGGGRQMRFGQERQGVGVESQMFGIKRKMEMGTATPEEMALYNGWIQETLPAMSGARAGGAETGRTIVRGTPQFQQTERNVAQQRGAGRVEGALSVEQTPAYQQNITAKATAHELGTPLDVTSQTAITAMGDAVDVAKQLKTNFTPEERAKYVGFLRFPATRIAQIFNNDPKFAQFQTLVNRAKSSAFGEGGKQLTPFEASVVFGYVPTGTEFSAADFEAKLNESLTRSQSLIDRRIKVGKTPRGQLNPQDIGGPATPRMPTGPNLPPGWNRAP